MSIFCFPLDFSSVSLPMRSDFFWRGRVLVLLALLIGTTAPPAWAAPATFYVSLQGSDDWSGTLSRPLADKTDGPLATFAGAKRVLTKMKSTDSYPKEGVVFEFLEGEYSLSNTVLLETESVTGKPDAPVVFRSGKNQKVTFTGALSIENAMPVRDKAVLDLLPEPARQQVRVANMYDLGLHQIPDWKRDPPLLFCNGQPMSLTRWPAKGFVKIVDVEENEPVDVRGTKGDKVGRFVYEDEKQGRWQGEPDAWLHGYWFWDWSEGRQAIASIDPNEKIIELKSPHHGYGYRKGQWYYAFNLLSELDKPGEWVFDHPGGKLYFWPPESTDPGKTNPDRITLSITENLIKVIGVAHLRFENLNFERTRGTALFIENSENIVVDSCTFRQIGTICVAMRGGNSNSVENCHLHELSNSGISLSGGDRKTLTRGNHRAINNRIHDYGRWKRMYCQAISLSGVGQRVAHNLIYDSPHIGISLSGNEHLIELNEIHHVCKESNDAGAIYTGRDWTMRGTIIRHNYLHHLQGLEKRGCEGIYLDDMASGMLLHGNVFFDVYRAFQIGGGRDVIVENNLIIDCKMGVYVDARALGWAKPSLDKSMKPKLDAMPIQSEIWKSRYPQLLILWDDNPGAPKGTVVRRNIGVNSSVNSKLLIISEEAKPYVTTENNLDLSSSQAGFIDGEEQDFRLKESSMIFQSLPGFQPIPFEKIGLQEPK